MIFGRIARLHRSQVPSGAVVNLKWPPLAISKAGNPCKNALKWSPSQGRKRENAGNHSTNAARPKQGGGDQKRPQKVTRTSQTRRTTLTSPPRRTSRTRPAALRER